MKYVCLLLMIFMVSCKKEKIKPVEKTIDVQVMVYAKNQSNTITSSSNIVRIRVK